MKRRLRSSLVVLILLTTEVVSTALIYRNNLISFAFGDVFFTWGLIDFLLGLTLIFGIENKMINLNFTRSGNENYVQSVSNFIGASSKNFFKRDRDVSAGSLLVILGLSNLGLYALILMLNP